MPSEIPVSYTHLVKAVITPFEGECFSAVPTVSAWTYDSQTDEEVEYAVTAALQDGNIVLTAAKPAENISELYIDCLLYTSRCV